jgi:hypothetical protein
MALRVGGQERNFWRAMQFALDHGAHVISMSMSWKYPVQPDYPGWRRACESVLAAGVLHANSIGNQGQLLGTHPIPYNIATPGNCPPPWLHPLQSPRGGLTSVVSRSLAPGPSSLRDATSSTTPSPSSLLPPTTTWSTVRPGGNGSDTSRSRS